MEVLQKLVVGQADITPLTIRNPTAGAALIYRSETPSVLEKDGLLALSDGIPQRFQQFPTEVSFHGPLLVGLAQIDEAYLGQ